MRYSWKLFGVSVSETPQNYRFGETTPLGYYEPLQTLNVELLRLAPSGLMFVKQAPFLTGSSVGSPLTPSGNAPQTDSSASANGKLGYRYLKKFCAN